MSEDERGCKGGYVTPDLPILALPDAVAALTPEEEQILRQRMAAWQAQRDSRLSQPRPWRHDDPVHCDWLIRITGELADTCRQSAQQEGLMPMTVEQLLVQYLAPNCGALLEHFAPEDPLMFWQIFAFTFLDQFLHAQYHWEIEEKKRIDLMESPAGKALVDHALQQSRAIAEALSQANQQAPEAEIPFQLPAAAKKHLH